MPRLLIHFARFGPYHHARLRAAHTILAPLGWEVIGLETAGTDATYAWAENQPDFERVRVVTAFPSRVHEEITAAECRNTLPRLLDELAPDALAIAGWGSPDALVCLSWCRKHEVKRIVMSETREADGKRMWWKEWIKRYLISRFDGALVGGKSHRDYLVKLGMSADKIHIGYNVVDNAYFAEEVAKSRRQGAGDREAGVRGQESGGGVSRATTNNQEPRTLPFFLASNRFVERKNLVRLLDVYAAYARREQMAGGRRQGSGDRDQESGGSTQQPVRRSFSEVGSSTWSLCLLGDGELKPALIAKCHELGLRVIESAPWEIPSSQSSINNPQSTIVNQASGCSPTAGIVFFPGFRQIDELPRFYAHAGCFVHPALEEPWGLVINEAMAAGLPILSGNNAGAAEELVDEGVNGWAFDATNVTEMVDCLTRVTELDEEARAALGQASKRILEERCPTEAFGLGLANLPLTSDL